MNLRHSHAGPPNIMLERIACSHSLAAAAQHARSASGRSWGRGSSIWPYTPHRSDRPGKAVALLDTSTGSRAESRIILDKLRARA